MKKSILFIAALAILTWLPCQMMAQEKGATKLLTLKTLPDLQQVEAGDTIVMSCPKCKDAFAVSRTPRFALISTTLAEPAVINPPPLSTRAAALKVPSTAPKEASLVTARRPAFTCTGPVSVEEPDNARVPSPFLISDAPVA